MPTGTPALYGAYAQAQFGTLAKTTLCGAGGAGGVFGGLAGVTGCNPDFAIGQMGIDHPLDPGQEPDVLG